MPNFFPSIHPDERQIFKKIFLWNFQDTVLKAEQILNNQFSWITPRCPKFRSKC